jgi:hypothetical protein
MVGGTPASGNYPSNAWEGLARLGLAEELVGALELLCGGQPLESRRAKPFDPLSTMERALALVEPAQP